MKDDITQPPAEGVYVYGLYLEGAGWDRRGCKLIESKPKVLFEMMPVVRMYAVNNGEISHPLIGWMRGGGGWGVEGCNWSPDCILSYCLTSEMENYFTSQDAEVALISSV